MDKTPSTDAEKPVKASSPLRIEEVVGALTIGLIFLISIANVIVRYATDASFAFTEEYSVFLLVVLTFVGASLAFVTNEHIRITYFVDRLGPVGQSVCNGIALLASVLMFALIVYYGTDLTIDEFRFEETSPGLGYPTWIYTLWLPLLSLLILIRIVQGAIRKRLKKNA